MTPPSLFSPAIPPAHFLYQPTAGGYFQSNGSEAGSGPPSPPPPRVRFLDRYFYDRQEIVRFDSDRGEYEALTTLGEDQARYWNSRREILEDARTMVDAFCRHNYGLAESFASGRKSKRVPGGGRASGAGGSVNGAGRGGAPRPQSCGARGQPPPDKGREGR
nr:HLA class II histocompatibility antigen, DRB1-16 beta chain-like [Pogona vitticeps]